MNADKTRVDKVRILTAVALPVPRLDLCMRLWRRLDLVDRRILVTTYQFNALQILVQFCKFLELSMPCGYGRYVKSLHDMHLLKCVVG
jgi:hypothetical protein